MAKWTYVKIKRTKWRYDKQGNAYQYNKKKKRYGGF